MSYQLFLNVHHGWCDGVEDLSEAIEFSMRNDTSRGGRWIPLRLNYYDNSANASHTGLEDVRGYLTLVHWGPSNSTTNQVYICGDVLLTNEVQFRWMATADSEIRGLYRSDFWALASVNATLVTWDERITLIQDAFGETKLK